MAGNVWLMGTLITFIVTAVCLLAVTFALKWYRPAFAAAKYLSMLTVGMAVVALASFSMLHQDERAALPAQDSESKLYKQVVWMENDSPDFALSQAKKLWAEEPTTGGKFLLGLSYLNAKQPEMGAAILTEVKQQAKSLSYIKESELDALLKDLPQPAPVSKAGAGANAGASGAGTAVPSPSASPLRAASPSASPQGATTPSASPQGVASPSASPQGATAPSASPQAAATPSASPQPAATAKPSAPEPDPATMRRIVQDGTKLLHDRLSKELKDETEKNLHTLAQLNPDRIDFTVKNQTGSSRQPAQDIQKLYQDTIQKPVDDPGFKEELAKTAIYMGDQTSAQKLLTDVLKDYPQAKEPAVLLSDMLLNGQRGNANGSGISAGTGTSNGAGTGLQSLPQYPEAKMKAQQEQKRLLQEWSNEVRIGDQSAAKVVSTRLQTIIGSLNMNDHLAYAILHPLEAAKDPQVLFLLSQYYYQMHDEDKSSALIHGIADDPSKLSKSQQYFVQSLQSLPSDPGRMTLDELQQRSRLTTDVYESLRPMEGKRLKPTPPTDKERSYAVHLSNELIRLSKSSIRISSIQASENGQVDLYVSADNVDALTKANLDIADSATIIKDFTVEKVSESSSYKRNIMMIMDKSGSMDGDRISTAKLSAQNFVNKLSHNEQVGLILFSDGNTTASALTTNTKSVSDAVASVSAGGGTNIAPAFYSGIDQLAKQSGERVVFMLSDGEDNNFSLAETRAGIIQKANEQGVTIFAIGFGAGYETLRDVAEATGGKYIAAAQLDDLINSFAEISKTLERSYHISYKLSPMTNGTHTVTLSGPSSTKAVKSYTIGAKPTDGSVPASGPLITDAQGVDFAITNTIPSRITASNLGTTVVQLNGVGLDQAAKLEFDNKEMSFDKKSDKRLDITVSNNLSLGIHKIKLITKDQRETIYNLSVTQSADQESREFGYATIYGDFIDDNGTDTRFLGNTSVDQFLFDIRGEMTLNNNKSLSFSGLLVNVDGTKVGVVPSLVLDNAGARLAPDDITMDLGKDEKTFSIARKGGGSVRRILDKATFEKFGLSVSIVPQFTYEAKYKKDDGTLKAKSAIEGFDTVTDLNQDLFEKLAKRIKFLPTEASLETEYEPANITVKGKVGAMLNMGSLVEGTNAKLEVGYGFGDGKLDIGGEVGGGKLFGFDLKLSVGPGSLDTFGVKLGWQGSKIPKAYEFSVEGDVPIGSTGLTANSAKVGADVREGFSGTVGLGVGTITDGPFKKVIKWVNKLPGVNLKEEDACVICIEGEANAKKLGTQDWSFDGAMTMKALGFETSKRTLYFDANEINAGLKIEAINFEGNFKAIWHDPNFTQDTTFKYLGTVDIMGLTGDLAALLDGSNFDRSYLDVNAKAWKFEPHIHLGADVKVYR